MYSFLPLPHVLTGCLVHAKCPPGASHREEGQSLGCGEGREWKPSVTGEAQTNRHRGLRWGRHVLFSRKVVSKSRRLPLPSRCFRSTLRRKSGAWRGTMGFLCWERRGSSPCREAGHILWGAQYVPSVRPDGFIPSYSHKRYHLHRRDHVVFVFAPSLAGSHVLQREEDLAQLWLNEHMNGLLTALAFLHKLCHCLYVFHIACLLCNRQKYAIQNIAWASLLVISFI